MAALDPFRDRPFMDLGRPVVDAEGADFPENLFDDAVARYPGTAHHLNAAVGDAHQRLGHGDLGDRTFLEAERSAVERVGDRKRTRLNYSHQCAPRMPSFV